MAEDGTLTITRGEGVTDDDFYYWRQKIWTVNDMFALHSENYESAVLKSRDEYADAYTAHAATLSLLTRARAQTVKEHDIGDLFAIKAGNSFTEMAYNIGMVSGNEGLIRGYDSFQKGKAVMEEALHSTDVEFGNNAFRYSTGVVAEQSANLVVAIGGTALGLPPSAIAAIFGVSTAGQTYGSLTIDQWRGDDAKLALVKLQSSFDEGLISRIDYLTSKTMLENVVERGDITQSEKVTSAILNGVIEGGITFAFGKIGVGTIGNAQKITGKGPSKFFTDTMKLDRWGRAGAYTKTFGKAIIGELMEEELIMLGTELSGLGILDRETNILKNARETFWATLITAGATNSTSLGYQSVATHVATRSMRANYLDGKTRIPALKRELNILIVEGKVNEAKLKRAELDQAVADMSSGMIASVDGNMLIAGPQKMQELIDLGMNKYVVLQQVGAKKGNTESQIQKLVDLHAGTLKGVQKTSFLNNWKALQTLESKLHGEFDISSGKVNEIIEKYYGSEGINILNGLKSTNAYNDATSSQKVGMVVAEVRAQLDNEMVAEHRRELEAGNKTSAANQETVEKMVYYKVNEEGNKEGVTFAEFQKTNDKATRSEKKENDVIAALLKNSVLLAATAVTSHKNGAAQIAKLQNEGTSIDYLNVNTVEDLSTLMKERGYTKPEIDKILKEFKGDQHGAMIPGENGGKTFVVINNEKALEAAKNGSYAGGMVVMHEASHALDRAAGLTASDIGNYGRKMINFMFKLQSAELKIIDGRIKDRMSNLSQGKWEHDSKGVPLAADQQSDLTIEEYTKRMQEELARLKNSPAKRNRDAYKSLLSNYGKMGIIKRLRSKNTYDINNGKDAFVYMIDFVETFNNGEVEMALNLRKKIRVKGGGKGTGGNTVVASEYESGGATDLLTQFDQFTMTEVGKDSNGAPVYKPKYKSKEEFQRSDDFADAWEKIADSGGKNDAFTQAMNKFIMKTGRQKGVPDLEGQLKDDFIRHVKDRLAEKFNAEYVPNKEAGGNNSLYGWIAGKNGVIGYAVLDVIKKYAAYDSHQGPSLDSKVGDGKSTLGDKMEGTTEVDAINVAKQGLTLFLQEHIKQLKAANASETELNQFTELLKDVEGDTATQLEEDLIDIGPKLTEQNFTREVIKLIQTEFRRQANKTPNTNIDTTSSSINFRRGLGIQKGGVFYNFVMSNAIKPLITAKAKLSDHNFKAELQKSFSDLIINGFSVSEQQLPSLIKEFWGLDTKSSGYATIYNKLYAAHITKGTNFNPLNTLMGAPASATYVNFLATHSELLFDLSPLSTLIKDRATDQNNNTIFYEEISGEGARLDAAQSKKLGITNIYAGNQIWAKRGLQSQPLVHPADNKKLGYVKGEPIMIVDADGVASQAIGIQEILNNQLAPAKGRPNSKKTTLMNGLAAELGLDASMEVVSMPENIERFKMVQETTESVKLDNIISELASKIDRGQETLFSEISPEIGLLVLDFLVTERNDIKEAFNIIQSNTPVLDVLNTSKHPLKGVMELLDIKQRNIVNKKINGLTSKLIKERNFRQMTINGQEIEFGWKKSIFIDENLNFPQDPSFDGLDSGGKAKAAKAAEIKIGGILTSPEGKNIVDNLKEEGKVRSDASFTFTFVPKGKGESGLVLARTSSVIGALQTASENGKKKGKKEQYVLDAHNFSVDRNKNLSEIVILLQALVSKNLITEGEVAAILNEGGKNKLNGLGFLYAGSILEGVEVDGKNDYVMGDKKSGWQWNNDHGTPRAELIQSIRGAIHQKGSQKGPAMEFVMDKIANYSSIIIKTTTHSNINTIYKDKTPVSTPHKGSSLHRIATVAPTFSNGIFIISKGVVVRATPADISKTTLTNFIDNANAEVKKLGYIDLAANPINKNTSAHSMYVIADQNQQMTDNLYSEIESKGITIWDADDTLLESKSNIRFKQPNPSGVPQSKYKAIFLVSPLNDYKSRVETSLQLKEQGFVPHNIDNLSKGITTEQEGPGMLIDSKGNSTPQVLKLKESLEARGYDTAIVVVTNQDSPGGTNQEFSQSFEGNYIEIDTKNLGQLDVLPTFTTDAVNNFTRGYIKGKLTPSEYAIHGEDLGNGGSKFDFSEFNEVIEGSPGIMLDIAKARNEKYGNKDVFILTARPHASALPIQLFLKSQGLDVRLENITGLGNSTAQAKADWVAGKLAEGYNDFYFSDDSMKNVDAVQSMLNQFDVKSKSVQAIKTEVLLSENEGTDLSGEFNQILEDSTGELKDSEATKTEASTMGSKIGRFKVFLTPSAQDFLGLIYKFLGKGKLGDAHLEFFKKHLIAPFNTAMNTLTSVSMNLNNDFKVWKKIVGLKSWEHKHIELEDGSKSHFTLGHAVRVYVQTAKGQEVSGLTEAELALLLHTVSANPDLLNAAQGLFNLLQKNAGIAEMGNNWLADGIAGDINNSINSKRAALISKWKNNASLVFSKENMFKIEKLFGTRFTTALKGVLYRMEHDSNPPSAGDSVIGKILNWVNGSVAVTMFFNTRTAVLQQLSILNYIDFKDNHIFAVARAMSNPKQFIKDFLFIFNSDFLVARRGGLKLDVNEAELARALTGSKNPITALFSRILKAGFLPTSIGDSFAIGIGGASFYRNRLRKYLKSVNPDTGVNYTQEEAASKAWSEFVYETETKQQSSRQDMLSQQQTGNLGRLILAYANTPAQYTRLMQKAYLDIVNGRGSLGSNLSKLAYYGIIQNFIFAALQSALFLAFGKDDEEERNKFLREKEGRILNSMLDSILRGTGIWGAAISTAKNVWFRKAEEDAQGFEGDHTYTLIEALNWSPTIGGKARSFYQATQVEKYEGKEIAEKGWGLDSPRWRAVGLYAAAALNMPINRVQSKISNIKYALDENTEATDAMLAWLGWNKWLLKDPEPKEVSTAVANEWGVKKDDSKEMKETRREARKTGLSTPDFIEQTKNLDSREKRRFMSEHARAKEFGVTLEEYKTLSVDEKNTIIRAKKIGVTREEYIAAEKKYNYGDFTKWRNNKRKAHRSKK
tara:strand:- start:7419 stop:16427 length:9009 start_codon:yes stop_codon:yes gene_type:complete